MMKKTLFPTLLLGSALLVGCAPPAPEAKMETPLRVFETLASDAMQGRATGTAGGERAREYLKQEMKALGVFDETRAQVFAFSPPSRDDGPTIELEGTNLIGVIDAEDADKTPILIVTAHYDHLGIRDGGVIYNGADDNASGSAALFAIAESFAERPPKHDVALVWLDAEERGLSGARAFVAGDPLVQGRPVFNLNLDMVSQNERELYFSGAHHYPILKTLMEKAAKGTGLTLSFGHDRPEDGPDDWTHQSDHAAFHAVGIPFGYLGVEDHPNYHGASDTFDTIPQEFYKSSVQTIVNAAHILDTYLDTVAKPAALETSEQSSQTDSE
ncbi:M28 family peptidase [Litorimonas haliclonae]|uniref:M28 family peptidase n=1 Tax=Litorimonas haliclonae TaxID=2081977 RepID=UPI0039EFA17F